MPRLASSFTLPDGTITSDPRLYSGTWLALVRAVEPILDATVTAFDPDLTIRRPDGSIFTLPLDVADLLLRLSGSAPAPVAGPPAKRRGRPPKSAASAPEATSPEPAA